MNELRKVHGLSTIHTNRKIQLDRFIHLRDNSLESALRDSPNAPDVVVVVDGLLKTTVILEVVVVVPAVNTCFNSRWL